MPAKLLRARKKQPWKPHQPSDLLTTVGINTCPRPQLSAGTCPGGKYFQCRP